MTDSRRIQDWVSTFADAVAQQTEAIKQGDSRTGNKLAKRYVAIFEKIRGVGDAARDAMIPLFRHPRVDVRVMAAAFLLRHRTEEALAVLRDEAGGQGLAAFSASQAIKRWEDGTWNLDPM